MADVIRPRLLLAGLALLVLLMAGCAPGSGEATATSSPPPSTTATPEVTPTPEAQTTTATPTEAVERTPTPTPEITTTNELTPTTELAPTPTLEATATPESTASPTVTPPPTASPAPTTAAGGGMDIRATRLQIPVLGIDAEVHASHEVPDTSPMPPGCPAKPPGQTTLTVPADGIATPEETFAGLERKSWIYGHSRWLGVPGLFFGLQSLNIGDELFVDGVERDSGTPVSGRRFVVEGLFLADTASGGSLVTAEQATPTPQVILQTSVRERGEGKAWILDRETLLQKSVNVVEGDLEDPCKYLLLFVVASAS